MLQERRARFVLVALMALVSSVVVPPFLSAAAGSATPPADSAEPNSANRVIFWSGCEDLMEMTDAELARWHRAGVGGFTCSTQWLNGMGGINRFTPDGESIPSGDAYALERALVKSDLVSRVHAQGMQLYFGWYLANSLNPQTPLAEWFDDAAWRDTVLPAIRENASMAKRLGFDGLTWDLEMYPQTDGRTTATWDWNYPGNERSETAVREQVRARGAELMTAVTDEFPDATILVYRAELPNTWDALVQQEVNGAERAFSQSTNLDFWNGVTSVDGPWSLVLLNALFYKTTHLDADWDTAYTYELNRLYELFSRRLDNWSQVADQVSASPFVWISAGSTSFEEARDPDYVAEQLLAARRWGMDRLFANYTYDTLRTFDYGPYRRGLRAAARPGRVDDERPTITANPPGRPTGDTVDLTGTATDNMAVRMVRWRADSGATGVATLDWVAEGSPESGYRWHTAFEASGIPIHDGANQITLTVEDVKGLTSSRLLTVQR